MSRDVWQSRLLAPFMAKVTAGGIRFHVQRLPAHRSSASADHLADSPTVVFVHGLGFDNMSSFYFTLANPAARAGANVILYDLRGHGDTERPTTDYSVDALVRDLTALLDALGVTEPVHLVGNSFGGTIALAMAITHPARVASLLLIEALTEAGIVAEDWEETMARAFAQGVQLRKSLANWGTIYGRKLRRIQAAFEALTNDTTLVADLQALPGFRSADLRSVTCPVVTIYGGDSEIIHHAHRLRELLPNCDLTIVPNCGHFLILEAPSAVRELLLRWLSLNAQPYVVLADHALVR